MITMNPYRMKRAEPRGRDMLILGWVAVRIAIFVAFAIAVVLAVTVVLRSIA